MSLSKPKEMSFNVTEGAVFLTEHDAGLLPRRVKANRFLNFRSMTARNPAKNYSIR